MSGPEDDGTSGDKTPGLSTLHDPPPVVKLAPEQIREIAEVAVKMMSSNAGRGLEEPRDTGDRGKKGMSVILTIGAISDMVTVT